MEGLQLPTRVFPCATPAGQRAVVLCCSVWPVRAFHECSCKADRAAQLMCLLNYCVLSNPACCPPPAPTHLRPTPATPVLRSRPLRCPCHSPADVRSTLPEGVDVLAFQCRNPIHRAHYELFIRALDAPNVSSEAVCLVHPTCGPTQVGWRAGG